MKKIIACLLLLFVLCGCGKTLSCKMTRTEESTGYEYEAIIDVKFKDDKVVDGKQTVVIDCKDEEAATQFSTYLESTNNDVVVEVNGSKLIVTSVDSNTLVENFGTFTYDELKETLEDAEYTCK